MSNSIPLIHLVAAKYIINFKFFEVSRREKLIQDIVTSPQQADKRCLKSGTNIITNKNTSSFNYWQSELIWSYIIIHFSRDCLVLYHLITSLWHIKSFFGVVGFQITTLHHQRLTALILMGKSLLSKPSFYIYQNYPWFFIYILSTTISHRHLSYIRFALARWVDYICKCSFHLV